MNPHWTQKVAEHPIVSKIVPHFGPNVDRVEIGIDSCRITFAIGTRFAANPRNGHSVCFKLITVFTTLDTPNEIHNFSITYGATQGQCGVLPSLYAIVEWWKEPL